MDDSDLGGSVSRVRTFARAVRANPIAGPMIKLAVAVIGFTIVAIGFVLIPAPGPGWLIVFAGLGILAVEFAWARRLLHYGRARFHAWTHWMGRQPLWLRGAVGLAGMALLSGLFLASLWVSGWRGFPFA